MYRLLFFNFIILRWQFFSYRIFKKLKILSSIIFFMKMSQSTQKIVENFDYKRLKEELDSVSQNLQKISEEVINMKVECVMANMELACTIDAIDFDSKVKDMEEMIKVFVTKEDMATSEDITEDKEHNINS